MPALKGVERLTKQAAMENAKAIGFQPGTIIDVGFAIGTKGIFDIFDGPVRHLLIEPMREAEPVMTRFCEEHPGSMYLIAAASDHEGQLEIVAKAGLTGSSIHGKADQFGEMRTIPTVTLDRVVRENALPGPYLIKLDVEGHEMHVLRGAAECLKQTEVIVTEIGTWAEDNPKGRASLMDIFRFMDENGFVFYEFLEPGYRPIDGALYTFDAIFVSRTSVLRKVRSHKTKEQGEQSRLHKEAKVQNAIKAAVKGRS